MAKLLIRAGVIFKNDTFQKMENLDKLDFNQEWIDDKRKHNIVVASLKISIRR